MYFLYEFNLLIFTVIISLITLTHQHGRLMEPPARNTMWRFGFQTPPNYEDSELFCGGLNVIDLNFFHDYYSSV